MSRSGAVLLHGKWDTPDGAIAPLADALTEIGLKVRRPHCCWSPRRHYDIDFAQAVAEVSAALDELRADGCGFVLLGGHSLGANAALAAASTGAAAVALLLIAPGHRPERLHAQGLTRDAIARVRTADPDRRLRLPDFNQGRCRLLRFRPAVWWSFFDPDGMAVLARSARRLRPPRPVLWLDAGLPDGSAGAVDDAFDLLPPHPQNLAVTLDGSHDTAPAAAVDRTIRWLNSLEARPWTT